MRLNILRVSIYRHSMLMRTTDRYARVAQLEKVSKTWVEFVMGHLILNEKLQKCNTREFRVSFVFFEANRDKEKGNWRLALIQRAWREKHEIAVRAHLFLARRRPSSLRNYIKRMYLSHSTALSWTDCKMLCKIVVSVLIIVHWSSVSIEILYFRK